MVNLDPVKRDEVYQAALSQARMNKQTIDQNVFELYNIKKNLNRYSMEKHRKFTWSVACLIFFFIGAPLGAIIRKGGLGMPTVVSILMFILYYMVAISGEKAAREDIWTMFEGMWLSTFIFFPLGFFLTYKAATDSGLLNVETYQYKIKKFVNYILRRKNDSVNSGYANSATNK
jgi:lipopolysaccharide export system permease protein